MAPDYYCGNCHLELPENASSCSHCGVRIGGSRDMHAQDREKIREKIRERNKRIYEINERIRKDKAFRKKENQEYRAEARRLLKLERNFKHIEKLSEKYQQEQNSKFVRQLLTPIRIKHLIKALRLDYPPKSDFKRIVS